MNIVIAVFLLAMSIMVVIMYSCVIIASDADDEMERMYQEFLTHRDMYKEYSGMGTHKNDK